MPTILKRLFGVAMLLLAALLLVGGGGCVVLTLPSVLSRGDIAATLIGLIVVGLGLGAWRVGLRAWRPRSSEPAPTSPPEP